MEPLKRLPQRREKEALERELEEEQEKLNQAKRKEQAASSLLVVLAAVVVAIAAGGWHCLEYWQCSEGDAAKCVRPRSSNATLTGFCTFTNLVSLAGDTLFSPGASSLLLQGICAPGERVQLNAVTNLQECVAYRSFPNALDESIMDPTASTHHERACGKWIHASSASGISSWSFYDDANWKAAVLHEEDASSKSHRTSVDNVGKFRSRCASTVLSGTSAIRVAAKQAYEYLSGPAPRSVDESLQQLGRLAGHSCDTPVSVGVSEYGNGFRMLVDDGSSYEEGTLSEALFAVEGVSYQAAAERANAHVNKYAWQSRVSLISELTTLVDGALGGRSSSAEATVRITPQLDGFLHLAKEGRFSEVDAFLRGVAALCSFSIVSSVSNAGGARLRARMAKLSSNKSRAAALGRLRVKDSSEGFEPMSEVDNTTLFNASAVTLLQLMGEPVGDAGSDCLELTRRVFPDRLEQEHFDATVTPLLYDRLEALFETAKDAVEATLRTNARIRGVLLNADAAANTIRRVRLRIPGAPLGTWAGTNRGVEEAQFLSEDGVFVMALKQARSLFLDRASRLGVEDADLCDGPPAFPALTTNAYIYPSFQCTFFLHGMLRRPFADEAYDNVSLVSRVGWVMAHELSHQVMVTKYLEPAYSTLFADYQPSVRNEAIADLVASVSLIESGLVSAEELCQHVSQMWCARVPLGFALSEQASHPAPNARGSKLCDLAAVAATPVAPVAAAAAVEAGSG
mgnify:CR=1 FL=1